MSLLILNLPRQSDQTLAEQGFDAAAEAALDVIVAELVPVGGARVGEVFLFDALELVLVALALQDGEELEILTFKNVIHLLATTFLELFDKSEIMGDVFIALYLAALSANPTGGG